MSVRGIIGPYSKSERYVKMLDEFVVPELQQFPGYYYRT